jgi:glycosyltransferase involved in cell wall biosynthesis
LPQGKKIILLQGAGINVQRGAEELCEAMAYIDGAILLIIGSGDVWNILQEKQKKPALMEKIVLISRLPAQELRHYTYNADLGVSIDKNTNPNYYNSLPNKIFDYINAGVPILATRLPEIERIVSQRGLGVFIENHEPAHIAEVINRVLFSDEFDRLKENTRLASAHFSWEHEKEALLGVIARAGKPVA